MEHISLVSLNVLARSKAVELHPSTEAAVLRWPGRRARLVEEVCGHSASVLCLQDVDDVRWWLVQLSGRGYDAIVGKDEVTPLVGWKQSEFQLVRSTIVELREAPTDDPSVRARARRCANLAVLAQLVPFNESAAGTSVLVASFELCEDEEAIRVLQIRHLVAEIEAFCRDAHVPVILAGTLHAPPDSDTFELVTRGRVRQLPRPPRPPPPPTCELDTVTVLSKSTVVLSWEPAVLNRARGDPLVEAFHIQQRCGACGDILGWEDAASISAVDATRYDTLIENGRRRTRIDPRYYATVGGLASGLAYEFRICAESFLGRGPWSNPSMPFSTPLMRDDDERQRHDRLTPQLPRLVMTADEVSGARSRELCASLTAKTSRVDERTDHPFASATGMTPRHNGTASSRPGPALAQQLAAEDDGAAACDPAELSCTTRLGLAVVDSPPFTVTTEQFGAIVADYVFYSSPQLDVVTVSTSPPELSIAPPAKATAASWLPNAQHASDHVSLIVHFQVHTDKTASRWA